MTAHVRLVVRSGRRIRYHALLREGFLVPLRSVRTLYSFLTGDLRIAPEYLSMRVSTVLLNGKPVDDVDTTIVTACSTLALSAALPGIAGASMRKGGYCAVLRSNITHHQAEEVEENIDGLVRVKLFNLVSDELGSLFLSRGVMVDAEALRALLDEIGDDLESGCAAADIDGRTVDSGVSLSEALRGAGRLVMVSIVTAEEAEFPPNGSRREGYTAEGQ